MNQIESIKFRYLNTLERIEHMEIIQIFLINMIVNKFYLFLLVGGEMIPKGKILTNVNAILSFGLNTKSH